MMKQLSIAFLIVTAFCLQSQESTVLASKDCIYTLHEFQQSLVNRSVNLDSLQAAFSPPNHQRSISFTVHYHFCTNTLNINSTTNILCSDIEEWVDDKNAGRDSVKDFGENYEHKFSWHASPINLFIRPKLLEYLSLYTFKVSERTTHIILDQLCETLSTYENTTLDSTLGKSTNQSSDAYYEVCYKPSPVLKLLEKLTANVREYVKVYLFTVVNGRCMIQCK